MLVEQKLRILTIRLLWLSRNEFAKKNALGDL